MRNICNKLIIGLFMLVSLPLWGRVQPAMVVHDASSLEWSLWGYRPNVWRMNFDFASLSGTWAECMDIPVTVPGSVQLALKNAGRIPDWNIGLNYTAAEWIENRHWL